MSPSAFEMFGSCPCFSNFSAVENGYNSIHTHTQSTTGYGEEGVRDGGGGDGDGERGECLFFFWGGGGGEKPISY